MNIDQTGQNELAPSVEPPRRLGRSCLAEGNYFLDLLAADQNRMILADCTGAVKQRSALDNQPVFLSRPGQSQGGKDKIDKDSVTATRIDD